MAATDFGTLFLDSGLRIKWFTDQVPIALTCPGSLRLSAS
jgi:hypothetical protein